MKSRVFVLAAFVLTGAAALSPASADTRTVYVPTDLKTDAQITAYTNALITASDQVCRMEASPLIGINVDLYHACRAATLRDTAGKDPTGLLATRLGFATKPGSLTTASK